MTIGELNVAQANAGWIMDLEDHLGVAVEATVQQDLTGTWALWVLNHLYLAAQLVVLPGSLVFLYRRSRPLYERLRNTILATWVLSIPIYAAFPVAPPRLADSGLVDTITAQTGLVARLVADHELLQRARRGAEPARRLRGRGRDLRRGRGPATRCSR